MKKIKNNKKLKGYLDKFGDGTTYLGVDPTSVFNQNGFNGNLYGNDLLSSNIKNPNTSLPQYTIDPNQQVGVQYSHPDYIAPKTNVTSNNGGKFDASGLMSNAAGMLQGAGFALMSDGLATMEEYKKDPIMQRTRQNHYAAYGLGGKTSGIPIEVEGNEVGETPNGETMEFKGNSHENGGIKTTMPEGSKIYSDRLEIEGKSMADRKKTRENKINKLAKLIEGNKGNKALENSVGRQIQFLEAEDQKDMQFQQMANQIYNNQKSQPKMAMGGYARHKYANGGEVTGDNIIVEDQGEYVQISDKNNPDSYVVFNKSQLPPNYDNNTLAYAFNSRIAQMNNVNPAINTDISIPTYSNTSVSEKPLNYNIQGMEQYPVSASFRYNNEKADGSPAPLTAYISQGGNNYMIPPSIYDPKEKDEKDLTTWWQQQGSKNPNNYTQQYGVTGYNGNIPLYSKDSGFNPAQYNIDPTSYNNLIGPPMENGQFYNNTIPSSVVANNTTVSNNAKIGINPTITPLNNKDNVEASANPSTFTNGERMGMIGNAVGTFAPMFNTLLNRLGDTPNPNFYQDYGTEAMRTNQKMFDATDAIKNASLQNIQLQGNTARNRNNNSSNSINTLRGLNFVTDNTLLNAKQNIMNNYQTQLAALNQQKASLQQTNEAQRIAGKISQDTNNRMDRDNYYTNMGQHLGNVGSLINSTAKSQVGLEERNNYLNLLAQMSPNGLEYKMDRNGIAKIVKQKKA